MQMMVDNMDGPELVEFNYEPEFDGEDNPLVADMEYPHHRVDVAVDVQFNSSYHSWRFLDISREDFQD